MRDRVHPEGQVTWPGLGWNHPWLDGAGTQCQACRAEQKAGKRGSQSLQKRTEAGKETARRETQVWSPVSSRSPANPTGDQGGQEREIPAQQHAGHELTAQEARPQGQSPAHTWPVRSSLVLSGPVAISVGDPWAGISVGDPWEGLSALHSSLVYALWICPLGDALGEKSDRPWLS